MSITLIFSAGYHKRVIDSATVYPRLFEISHHFDHSEHCTDTWESASWRSCSSSVCYLNTPPWPLTDLVSRSHCSARFRSMCFAHAGTATVSTSNNSPEISDVTHQFSLDQLVLQREFQSSSSSMLNLIDFLVLVHGVVTVRVLRAHTQALIVSNFQCLRVCHRCFFEVHCLQSVSAFTSFVSMSALVDSRGTVSTETPCPDVRLCHSDPLP